MRQKYTILKDLNAIDMGGPFDSSAGSFRGTSSSGQSEPHVETQELSKSDVVDFTKDPTVAAIAPVMPTKLITPVEMEGIQAAESTWGIKAVGADKSSFTGAGVIVSVLDTGIDADHEAFSGMTIEQVDFSGDGDGDVQGHGTHCAGTVFGRDVEGKRIGVAPGIERAFIGKVLGDDGSGDSQMLFDGMQWAARMRADVISMSLGFDFPGLVNRLVKFDGYPVDLATSLALDGYRANLRMFDAIMSMVNRQGPFRGSPVVIAAAGNESKRNEHPNYELGASVPAAAEGVCSVGALSEGEDGFEIAYFSNTFPQIAAPGVNILSAKSGGGLKALSGTSMACPHVAGLAALWWESVRSRPVSATAPIVKASILAAAKTDPISNNVDVADRGVGLAMAP